MLNKFHEKQQGMELIILEQLVPQDHLLRKIDRSIDFSFIRRLCAPLYSANLGRPAIEPEVLFRMLFVGYLYGIRSERRLEEEINYNIAYKWFCGLDLTDKAPDATTISQNRRRRFRDNNIAEEIFNEILRQAMEKGLVGGTILYTDSTHVKAKANKHKKMTVVVERTPKAYLEELDEAIEILGRNTTLPAEAWSRYDGVYYGNIAQWLKYANSLKLRMAMRLSYVKPDIARAKAAEAIAGGIITVNADNAAMHAAENRMTLIYNDWGDHRVGADIISYLDGYDDPRLEKMFLPNDVDDYVGIRIGIDVAGKSTAMSKYSNMIVASDTPYLWFNAAEATFLHAEYELRWGSAETAKTLYEQAVRLSFEERGASGADAYLVDATKKPAPYTDPLGNYSASARSEITVPWETATDGSDTEAVQERNLERIIVQKWIAIFPLGVEAWSEHRRTGYPKLLPVPTDKSGGSVNVEQGARRLPYPVEEYQQNNANLQAAIQTLGAEQQNGDRSGDVMGTRVWWDCKPYNK